MQPCVRPVVCRALAGLALAALVLPIAATARADGPTVPQGFQITAAIPKIHHPTRLAFGPDGRLYITQQTGEVMAITLENGKEIERQQVAQAKLNVLGLAFRGNDLYISDPGMISIYHRSPQGTYAGRTEIVAGLPNGRHQNDGLAFGPDGKLYWGQGTTTDAGPESDPRAGTIMRANADGTQVEIYARGLRNPYGITFTPDGELWATDNGQDDPPSEDELNHIVRGGDYGWPKVLGMPPAGSKTIAPVLLLGMHNSSDGLVYYASRAFPAHYQGGFFIAEWGSSFGDDVGRAVGFVRVSKTPQGEKGTHEVFARGFNRPLDVTAGPTGDLWVADFYANTVYRIAYVGGGGAASGGSSGGSGGGGSPSAGGQPGPDGHIPVDPPGRGHGGNFVGGALVAILALGGLLVWIRGRRRNGGR